MSREHQNPVIAAEVRNEIEATLLIAALGDAGIPATSSGQLTASFRAEAPGWIRVLVRAQDADRAREVVEEWRGDRSEPAADD